MADNHQQILSRRQWLGLASTSTVAASLASGLPTPSTSAAETDQAAPNDDLGARVYNVRHYGAKGDGQTLDTAAVQAAIDACNKDQGGTVLVPAGVFLIGPVEMKSNVTLHLAAQGTLLGTADGKQYHQNEAIPLRGDTTLNDGNVALIFALKAENITIEGPGTIDGQGAQFRSPATGQPSPVGIPGPVRPHHVVLYQCKNVRVRDLYLLACAYHSVRIIESSFVWLTGLRIYSRVNGNNDGFHFISSQNVHLSNCDVRCGDDACALFGSCKNVTITNSSFSTRWSVFRFGGGNPENITVSNCVIYETYGCPIKMQFNRETQAQNILFSNLVLRDVTGPISISLNAKTSRAGSENAPPGFVRNIRFNGIQARVLAVRGQYPDFAFRSDHRPGEVRQCIVLNCIGDSAIEGVVLSDVSMSYEGGGTAAEAEREVPQVAAEYFEIGTPPAYGLYARNVRGLTLQNVRFEHEQPDLRPAVVFDHVTDVAINGLSAEGDKEAASVLRFIATHQALLTAARVLKQAAVFLQVEDAASEGIIVEGGDLSKAAAPLAFKNGAVKESVKLRE